AFEGYDYARALERTEAFFWGFCDDYVELVKNRAYGTLGAEAAASAQVTLQLALSTLLRLFAPFLPFVTEEVWSWWQDGSVHRAPWPAAAELDLGGAAAEDGALVDDVAWVLGHVRSAKSAAKRSMRWPVARVTVVASPARIAGISLAADDLKEAGVVAELVLRDSGKDDDGADDGVDVELAPEAA
ncbi:MAG TPA: class I tRNA ligase family protein, partial [Acidimicrobiales bacterium]|nr:class I tRNA ligase family protein [Acidimicrobiales bacterium]